MRDLARSQRHSNLWILAIFLFGLPQAYSKFEQTTGTKVDSSKFGGMSEEELSEFEKQLESEYTRTIYENIRKFEAGTKSSKFDGDGSGGSGRYSGYGEAHITMGDSMVSHEGGANAMERAVEVGAFGQTGLSGQARTDKEKEIMEQRTVPLKDSNGKQKYDKNGFPQFRNTLTGQIQTKTFEISAALYDAGPAHGDSPDDPHRVYGLKAEVRKESEKNSADYAAKAIRDATLEPGKQPNLDLLHKEFSKMEQDKYIMMASDAFAMRAARLAGADTTKSQDRAVVGEFKQMAIDIYADKKFEGNVQAAEAAIKQQLAGRIAERQVLADQDMCANGSFGDCSKLNLPASAPEKLTADKAALKILGLLQASQDGRNVQIIKDKIAAVFQDDKGNLVEKDNIKLSDLTSRIELGDLAGVLGTEQLKQKYAEAKQSADKNELAKIPEYEQRLTANECLSFTQFCFSGYGLTDKNKQQVAGSNQPKDDKSKIEQNIFQKINGDPGAFFSDTREIIYNQFAYAYNRPLAEWKSIVTTADFNESTDKNIKDVGPYKEFLSMYDKAMTAAEDIKNNADQIVIDRLKSAGATPEQIARIQKNYSLKFDPKRMTHMELFGQNKQRDALMMDWRQGQGSGGTQFYNPNKVQKPTAGLPIPNPLSRSPGTIDAPPPSSPTLN